MDRHLPDDQLDRALLGFFTGRRDELLASAPTTHLVAARIAATVAPTTARRPRPALALLAALLVTLLAAAAVVVGSGLLRPIPIPAERGVFTLTGSPSEQRGDLAATLLADGRVLVVGDTGAEAWDPETGTFSPAGTLTQPQGSSTATLLEGGRVLVVGGSRAELWDHLTSSFTASGTLQASHQTPITITLPDGRVLIAGGDRSLVGNVAAAEVWDPATGAFSPVTWPEGPGRTRAAVLLRDGRVLVLGRTGADTWEAITWDPTTQRSTPTGAPIPGHVPHRATLLPDGRVAVSSGCDTICIDIWDPETGIFTVAGQSAQAHRGPSAIGAQDGPTVTLLRDGRILVAGGWGAPRTAGCAVDAGTWDSGDSSCGTPTDAAELWDPVSRSFSPTGSMNQAWSVATATLLPDGRVLVVGGDFAADTVSAELFTLR